jgi:hypothetical protein
MKMRPAYIIEAVAMIVLTALVFTNPHSGGENLAVGHRFLTPPIHSLVSTLSGHPNEASV